MNYCYFQTVVYADIPFIQFFSISKEDRNKTYVASIQFIRFLQALEQQNGNYPVQLAMPPTYYEILELTSFQEEMTEFLENNQQEYKEEYEYWLKYHKQLNETIKKLMKNNKLDLLACPATFSTLPNISTQSGFTLQIEAGLAILQNLFAYQAKGFWFPQGRYAPGLDLYLNKAGIKFSFIRNETIYYSDPAPLEEGTAVVSPHDIIFFPIQENLYDLLNNDNKQKVMVEKEMVALTNKYNHYRQQSVISLVMELTAYHFRKKELDKQLTYLMDEGFVVHISPSMYIKQFSQDLDKVHLSASFLQEINDIDIERYGKYYAASSFIEKELEQWKRLQLPSKAIRIIKALEKEWLFLTGLLSPVLEKNRNKIENHIEAAVKISESFHNQYDENMLISREEQFPVLNHSFKIMSQREVKVEQNGKKKVLLLSWEYPPNVVGGLGTHVAGLCESLIKKDYEVHLITTQDIKAEPYDCKEREGLFVYRVKPIYSLEANFIHWIGGLNISMWNKGMELAAFYPFDIIHAHDWLVGAAAISLQKELNIPLVSTIHATEHGRNGGIYTEMQRFIHNKEKHLIASSHLIIVCSEFMKEEVMNIFQTERDKITIIPNGVNAQAIKDISISTIHEFSINKQKRIIFAIGRLVKEKGFGTLLEAAKRFRQKNSNVFFVLAGVGPMYDEYKKYIEKNNLQSTVLLTGYLQEEKKRAFYQLAEIAVIPSHYEPFGIVALESLVFAKPTIVSNTGGLKGIVDHKKTGILIDPGNVNDLIEAIQFLLENKREAKEIGNNGRKLVEQLFSWNRVGDETKRVFDELLIQNKMKENV
ncbi:glycosyltransferase [Niallia sp. 03190]|uniref:glycosyltransferase n=1 Tax=Niallia sp. 03190 TaxID=3458061 RepID=UPI0040449457